MPKRLDWQFANGVSLARCSVDESTSPGAATAQVVLYWTLRDQTPAPFAVQLLIVELNGRTLGAAHGRAHAGPGPVQEWQPDRV